MDRLIYRIFLFLLIFSPLAFGTVERWSLAIVETFSILALFLLFLRNKKEPFYHVPGIIPLILFLTYIFLQLIPLPAAIVKIFSPATHALYTETIGVVEPAPWMSLSINKKATLAEFFRFAAYVSFYVVTIQLLIKKTWLKETVNVLIVFAAFLSVLALLQEVLSNDKIFWFRKVSVIGIPFAPFGPFVNRNHFPAFMLMIFPVVLGLFFYYKPRVRYGALRERLTEILNQQRTSAYILIGFSALLIGTSILVARSRGAIISFGLSSILLVLMLIHKGKVRRDSGILLLLLMILLLISVGWFGWDPIFKKFEGNIVQSRLPIWKDCTYMIRDFPLTGAGLGTFVYLYPAYRTVPGGDILGYAHNDFVELVTDAGVIGFLFAAWFLIDLLYRSFGDFRKRRESYSICLYLGSVTGIIGILMHSFTEFNLHIGANGLYFFFLGGLAVSAANTRLREGLGHTKLPKLWSPGLKILGFPVAIVLIACLLFNLGALTGKFYFLPFGDKVMKDDRTRKTLLKLNRAALRASFYDPLEAKYPFEAAQTEALLSNSFKALPQYKKALRLNPANSEYLQRLGLSLPGDEGEDMAGQLLHASLKYDRTNPERYKAYASWLFSRGKKEKGKEIITRAISLDPTKTMNYITFMQLYRFDDEGIRSAMPERAGPYLAFGDYMYRKGNERMAEKAYLRALQYIKNEDIVEPGYFCKVSDFYAKKGLYDEALKVMRKAIEVLPHDVKIRVITAALYDKLGITYRAEEEYQKALALDPENRDAKRRLEEITRK